MARTIYKAGYAVYLVLFIFAVMFYKERIIILDDAFYLFNIVNDVSFTIQHLRFIAVVTEIFPLIAVKLALPLKMVVLSYSAGFIIYYFLCYLICGWLRQYKMGIALLMFNIMFSTHTFYWMLSELTQGVAMMMPLLAFVASDKFGKNKWITTIVMAIVIPTLAFAHPLLIIPFSFALLFLLLHKDGIGFNKAAITGGAFILVIVLKNTVFKDPYDSQSMQGLGNFKSLFPNYFDIHSNRLFLENCVTKYYWIPIIFFATVITYIVSRQWKKLALVCCYAVGFILLINISYPSNFTQEFYIENLYLPLGVLLALPFVYDVIPLLERRKLAAIVMTVFAVACLIRIYKGHEFYTARLAFLRHYMITHENEKLMVSANHLPMMTLLMTFGSPYEFWLLSTIERGKTASIVFSDKIPEVIWCRNCKRDFVTTWGAFPYKELNPRYFKFTDTSSVYKVID